MWPYWWHNGSCRVSECRTGRQDYWGCARRHVAELLTLRDLSRECLQYPPSRLMWMCNGYTACGRIVGNRVPVPWVSAQGPSSREWLFNWYMECGRFGGITGTLSWVSSHPPSILVWMSNGYTASGRIVGTTCIGPWVSAAPSVKSSVNAPWIYGMWPYCWHYGNWPVVRAETSV